MLLFLFQTLRPSIAPKATFPTTDPNGIGPETFPHTGPNGLGAATDPLGLGPNVDPGGGPVFSFPISDPNGSGPHVDPGGGPVKGFPSADPNGGPVAAGPYVDPGGGPVFGFPHRRPERFADGWQWLHRAGRRAGAHANGRWSRRRRIGMIRSCVASSKPRASEHRSASTSSRAMRQRRGWLLASSKR